MRNSSSKRDCSRKQGQLSEVAAAAGMDTHSEEAALQQLMQDELDAATTRAELRACLKAARKAQVPQKVLARKAAELAQLATADLRAAAREDVGAMLTLAEADGADPALVAQCRRDLVARWEVRAVVVCCGRLSAS